VQAVANLLPDTDGVRVRATISASVCGERLLAVADGRVAGLLRREGANAWRGVALGTPTQHWELYTSCD